MIIGLVRTAWGWRKSRPWRSQKYPKASIPAPRYIFWAGCSLLCQLAEHVYRKLDVLMMQRCIRCGRPTPNAGYCDSCEEDMAWSSPLFFS